MLAHTDTYKLPPVYYSNSSCTTFVAILLFAVTHHMSDHDHASEHKIYLKQHTTKHWYTNFETSVGTMKVKSRRSVDVILQQADRGQERTRGREVMYSKKGTIAIYRNPELV